MRCVFEYGLAAQSLARTLDFDLNWPKWIGLISAVGFFGIRLAISRLQLILLMLEKFPRLTLSNSVVLVFALRHHNTACGTSPKPVSTAKVSMQVNLVVRGHGQLLLSLWHKG